MEKIVVVGGGGHAKVVISLLKKLKRFDILGYVDFEDMGFILGVSYLGSDERLVRIKERYPMCAAAIGVGCVEIRDRRMRIKEKLESLGFDLPVLISPHAIVNEGVEIGRGTVVMDGVVIQAGTVIGEAAIINTRSSIDHDCRIGDFVHMAPGATLSGGVVVGRNALIGVGATVIQNKTICEDCFIGAGATIVEDCLTPGIFLGTPARIKS